MWSDSTSFTGCPGKRMYSREESISAVFLTFEKLNRVCHALLLKSWIVSVMLYPDLTIARFYI